MTRATRVLLAGLVTASTLTMPAVSRGAGTQPTLLAPTTPIHVGDEIVVTGAGWPQGSSVHLEVCGANAVGGSADCASTSGRRATPGADGTLQGHVPIVAPPSPCPCVVLATAKPARFSTRVPINLVLDGAAADLPRPPELRVNARVRTGSSIGALFGVPTSRSLEITVANHGEVTAGQVHVTTRWRSGPRRGTLRVETVGQLAAGEQRTVTIPFDTDVLAQRDIEVVGSAATAFERTEFTTDAEPVRPWGLLGVVVLGVHFGFLRVRNRLRSRIERSAARDVASAQAAPEPVVQG